MKYVKVYQMFAHQKIFSLSDLRKIDPDFCMANITHRKNKKYIKSLTKWWYYFLDQDISLQDMMTIANRLYSPSYISLESVLNMYNILPEAVPNIISISTKKTQTLSTDLWTFSYRHIKPSMFRGYDIKKVSQQTNNIYFPYKIATIEKTIVDYLYLHTILTTFEDFYELRWNIDELITQRDEKKFLWYVTQIKQQRFQQRVEMFISFIHSDDRHYDY